MAKRKRTEDDMTIREHKSDGEVPADTQNPLDWRRKADEITSDSTRANALLPSVKSPESADAQPPSLEEDRKEASSLVVGVSRWLETAPVAVLMGILHRNDVVMRPYKLGTPEAVVPLEQERNQILADLRLAWELDPLHVWNACVRAKWEEDALVAAESCPMADTVAQGRIPPYFHPTKREGRGCFDTALRSTRRRPGILQAQEKLPLPKGTAAKGMGNPCPSCSHVPSLGHLQDG